MIQYEKQIYSNEVSNHFMTQQVKKKKCYLYTRVSTVAQTDGFSLEAQSKSLYEYAKYRELEIADEYCDAG